MRNTSHLRYFIRAVLINEAVGGTSASGKKAYIMGRADGSSSRYASKSSGKTVAAAGITIASNKLLSIQWEIGSASHQRLLEWMRSKNPTFQDQQNVSIVANEPRSRVISICESEFGRVPSEIIISASAGVGSDNSADILNNNVDIDNLVFFISINLGEITVSDFDTDTIDGEDSHKMTQSEWNSSTSSILSVISNEINVSPLRSDSVEYDILNSR